MDEILVTGIGPIVTTATSNQAEGISIEILTAEDVGSLVMSEAVAMELAAAIVKHLRREQPPSNDANSSAKKTK